ncbi:kinase protein [Acanthocystis turfacea Chlorella virus GM0701.1]|nr:kinase protein [Acanthocystis turfacea Chlorella virus GM0701.1]
MVVISIEGLMGTGKSTVLAALKERGFKVVTEPVKKWTFLQKFYDDPRKYSLALQIQILLTFAEQEFPEDEVVFVERSPAVSRYVFANMLRSEGLMTDEATNVYSELYEKLELWKPDGYIFLDAPVDTCLKRQESRGDSYNITRQYMTNLEKYYNIFFKYNTRDIVDSSRPVEDVVTDVLAAVERMKSKSDSASSASNSC